MNKSTLIAFVAGAAIGSVVAFQFAKKKYEALKNDEIEELRAYYAKKQPRDEEPKKTFHVEEAETASVIDEKPNIAEYAKILSKAGYIGYDGYSAKEKKPVVAEESKERPYVISPDEFGEMDNYNKISLMYYADGVLCDDMDSPVDNIDEIVGADFADHFGEYEDDSVFIRNDPRKCDYEILRSLRTYEEVIAENPYKAEV